LYLKGVHNEKEGWCDADEGAEQDLG